MLMIRKPEDIYQIDGEVQNGTFHGRWHFSFGEYYDRDFVHSEHCASSTTTRCRRAWYGRSIRIATTR